MKSLWCYRLGIAATACLSILVTAAGSEPGEMAPLSGLWVGDTEYGPPAQGALTVTLQGGSGRAEIAGKTATFAVAGDSIRVDFGGKVGKFRGRIDRRAAEIRGFWIQPPTTDAMGPFGQPYATPVRLAKIATDRYRATVVPLANRLTLYLYMWSDSTGWRGAFRNPQFNLNGGASKFRVHGAGDSLYFSAKFADPNEPEIRAVAGWNPADSTLRIAWQGFEPVAILRPCPPARTAGFWPRPPGAKAVYRAPEDTGDQWQTARAASVGLDEAALARFTQSVADTNPTAARAPIIHSCLIERHGRLVYEEYFFGFDRRATHDLRSASKTFTSVLIGTAMRSGAAIRPDQPIDSLLHYRGPFANPDPRKSRITIGQLLTHTSGLACDDYGESSPGEEGTMQRSSIDWWKFTLDLPLEHEPGTHHAYCSGGLNLVGGALVTATWRWLPELFDSTVARPLGFGPYYFNLMPDGEGYLGGGVHMRPRDLLKLGRTYLNGGVWQGQRLIDSTWVQISTIDQVADTTQTEGYAWHLNALRHGDRVYREYEAGGNGGQFLIVLPELDMSIVFTGGNYMMYGIWRNFRDDFVPNRILPAVRDRAAR